MVTTAGQLRREKEGNVEEAEAKRDTRARLLQGQKSRKAAPAVPRVLHLLPGLLICFRQLPLPSFRVLVPESVLLGYSHCSPICQLFMSTFTLEPATFHLLFCGFLEHPPTGVLGRLASVGRPSPVLFVVSPVFYMCAFAYSRNE